jgi:hypothetical protein
MAGLEKTGGNETSPENRLSLSYHPTLGGTYDRMPIATRVKSKENVTGLSTVYGANKRAEQDKERKKSQRMAFPPVPFVGIIRIPQRGRRGKVPET